MTYQEIIWTIATADEALAAKIEGQQGFLSNDDLASLTGYVIAGQLPTFEVLIRCNLGRELCPVTLARPRADAIDANGEANQIELGDGVSIPADWVRDISIPARL